MAVANASIATSSTTTPTYGTLSSGNTQWDIPAGTPVGATWVARNVTFTTDGLMPTESKLTAITVTCPAQKVTTGGLEERANVSISLNIVCAGQGYGKTIYSGQEQQTTGSVTGTDNAPNFFWVDSNATISLSITFMNQDNFYATSHYCGAPTLSFTYDNGQVKNLFFGSDF